MSPILSLAFDGVIALLLVVAIVYMATLKRRLAHLRDTKIELERVLAGFGEATAKAGASIAQLKSVSAQAGQLDRQDRERLDNALALRDDLAFLLDRGNQLADRLESAVRDARDGAARSASVTPLSAARPASGTSQSSRVASETEQALVEALRKAR